MPLAALHPPTPARRRPSRPRAGGRLRVIWTCCAVLAGAAHADPAAPADPLLVLLQDRGLAVTASVAQKVSTSTSTSVEGAAEALRQARDTASALVVGAMNFLGVPYRRGGSAAEEGFDCSGFTRHVFESALGIVLPRRAAEQAREPGLKVVARDKLAPGDLVFFNTMRRAFSHVGIYVGEGRFIHAPRAGSEVRIERMDSRYWAARFNGARRPAIAPEVEAAPTPPRASHGAEAMPAAAPGPAVPGPSAELP